MEQDQINIVDNTYKVPKEFKKQVAELKLQRSLDVISNETYYGQLAKLRDTYLEKGTSDWWRYTKEISSYEKSLIQQQKKDIIGLYTDIAVESGKQMDEVIKLQDKMAKKLKNYGDLFENISITQNGRTSEFTALRDLSTDTLKLQAYKKAIEVVKGRGAPQDFLTVLKGMSVEDGTAFSNRLLQSNDSDFKNYISEWTKKQAVADEISKQLYQDEADNVISDLTKKLEEAGLEVPKGFFENGKDAAENFGTGFLSEIDNVMSKIKDAISVNMAGVIGNLSVSGGLQSSKNSAISYNNSFTICSSKNTASEQIQAWRSATQIEKMRGGS